MSCTIWLQYSYIVTTCQEKCGFWLKAIALFSKMEWLSFHPSNREQMVMLKMESRWGKDPQENSKSKGCRSPHRLLLLLRIPWHEPPMIGPLLCVKEEPRWIERPNRPRMWLRSSSQPCRSCSSGKEGQGERSFPRWEPILFHWQKKSGCYNKSRLFGRLPITYWQNRAIVL